jgi:hypothetical protein
MVAGANPRPVLEVTPSDDVIRSRLCTDEFPFNAFRRTITLGVAEQRYAQAFHGDADLLSDFPVDCDVSVERVHGPLPMLPTPSSSVIS